MAAAKKGPVKGKRPPKKALRGRMPVKRSINLMLIDENRISPVKATLGIIVIVALAALFSKFMVADRLAMMSSASGKANQLKDTLDQTMEAIERYEGVEDSYAHLTYAGMTQEEMSRVDRVRVLELVADILPDNETAKTWSVTGNIMTVEITGRTLEELNELARRVEESPIVDSCVITTAKKDELKALEPASRSTGSGNLSEALERRRIAVEGGLVDTMLSALTGKGIQPTEEVQARFTVYLKQPTEPDKTPEPETDADAEEAPAESEAPEAAPEAAEPAETQAAEVNAEPTEKPSKPSRAPTAEPTEAPAETPTPTPTQAPTQAPTEAPTQLPEETADPYESWEVIAP